MGRMRAARLSLVVAALVLGMPGDAQAFAHIEGGGTLNGGKATFSPGLTATGTAPQTITLTTHGAGAAWHLIYADVITWKCDFTISNVNLGAETAAAGVGTAVGGCIGYPYTRVTGGGTVNISCPLIGPMAYARVGTVVTLNGVCIAEWNFVADIADVTMAFNILPMPPNPNDPGAPVTDFIVGSGAFRYRG